MVDGDVGVDNCGPSSDFVLSLLHLSQGNCASFIAHTTVMYLMKAVLPLTEMQIARDGRVNMYIFKLVDSAVWLIAISYF